MTGELAVVLILLKLNDMKYEKPKVTMIEADFGLLSGSGPGADDIGSPSVSNECKSVWDEDINDNEAIDYEI